MEEIATPPVTPSQTPVLKKRDWLGIASLTIFVVLCLGAVVFFYNQNQQLKKMLASYQTPIATATPLPSQTPMPSFVTNGVYSNTKYSFTIPVGFTVESENNNEWTQSIKIVDDQGVTFGLFITPEVELNCVKEIDNYLKTIDGKEVRWKIYQGDEPGEFPGCVSDSSTEYDIWITLEEYKPPKEGTIGLIWYSFDTKNVTYDNALKTLDQILSTFKFLD